MKNPFKKSIETSQLIPAVSNGADIDEIKRIIKLNPNSVFETDTLEEGYTALHYAAWDGNDECVNILLESGADVDPVAKDGYTPFMLAANNNHYDATVLLVKKGADINRTVMADDICQGKSGMSSLRRAAINQYWDIVDYLISQKANLEILLEPCLGMPGGVSNLIEVIRYHGKTNLNININNEKINKLENILEQLLDKTNDQNKAAEELEDDTKGYPLINIRIKNDENGNPDIKLNNRINQYLANWQYPTESYNGRMGIEGRIPTWIDKIDSNDCCPKFTNNDIEFINNKIVSEKIIPVLNFAPEEFNKAAKQIWWIVPLTIWAGNKASWLFIDKNGFYAAHPGDEDIAMIFPWERLEDMEYLDEDLETDESEVHSVNLVFDTGELTFVELVSPGQGSYLSVINSIYEIRKETLEASIGEDTWLEGVGGEGFKVFEKPTDLLTDKNWENPNRPKPALFGYNIKEDLKTAENYFKQGREKLDNKDYEGALEDLNKVIEMDPDYPGAFYFRAVAKEKLNDYSGSEEDYTTTISSISNNSGIFYERGNVRFNLNKFDFAIEDFSKAIELDSNYKWAYQNRGNAKRELKDGEGAIEDYSKVIEIDPNYLWAYQQRGETKSELNDFDGAIEDFSKVIEIDPNYKWAYQQRAISKSKLNDHNGVIEDLSKVIEIDSDNKWNYWKRAEAKKEINDFKEAIIDYNKAVELDPNYDWAYYGRGLANKALKNYESAKIDLNKAIEVNPNWWLLYKVRGEVEVSQEDYENVIDDFSKAIELHPYGSWEYISNDLLFLIEAIEKKSDFNLNTIKKEMNIIELERTPLMEFLMKLKIEIGKLNLDNITSDAEESMLSDVSDSSKVEDEYSVTRVSNVILFNDFDSWISQMKNGQKEDENLDIKNRKPLNIPEETEKIVRKIFKRINLEYKDEGELLTYKFSPTGGCTAYFKDRKVAGIEIGIKGNIRLMILRDYNKNYFRPNIENLNINNIREEQISHKVPWGYAFFEILDLPKLIDENSDTIIKLIGDGINTIKYGKILSLKANEFRKLKPIFDGTFKA